MASNDDKVMKEWADGYIEQYGQALLEEQRIIEEQGLRYAIPRADARVGQLTAQSATGRKKRSRVPLVAAAAAILVLTVGASTIFINQNALFSELSEPTALTNDTADGILDPVLAVKMLNFNLPAQYMVAEAKLDQGETIYHLKSNRLEDVVMTIKKPQDQDGWMQGLDEVYIDNKLVPARINTDYKLLIFENHGLLYTISCREDLSSLIPLYHSITDPENQNV